MKTKLFVVSAFLGLTLGVFLTPKAQAAIPRSPKRGFVSLYSTSVSTITTGPGAVYQISLSSGAASEYILLCDTSSAANITATSNIGTNANNCTSRFFFGSTTAGTDYKFDPPLLFGNGIYVIDSAATGQATITFEPGRGLSGE